VKHLLSRRLRASLACSLALVVAQPSAAFAQTTARPAVIAPNENLVAEGIPPIPAELAEAVKKYTEVNPVSFADWHPTRREMIVRKRAGNTLQAHLLAAPGAGAKPLTSFPDAVAGSTYQQKSGDYFVFGKGAGGNEVLQLFRYDLANGAVTRLTPDDRKQARPGPWSNAGDRMVYGTVGVGAQAGVNLELHLINPADPQSDRVVTTFDGPAWGVSDWSPDDRRLAVSNYVSINESYLWLLDLETGRKTPLMPPSGGEKVSYQGARFSRDGKGLYTVTDRDSEFGRLAYVDLAGGKHTYLTSHIKWDVESFDLSPDGKLVAFITNEDGVGVLRLMDTATGKERKLPRLPVGVVNGVEWHKNGRDLAIDLASFGAVVEVYSLDVTTMKLERWASAELNGLDARGLKAPELIRWKSFDSRMISGFLYRPPSRFTGKRPVIINIHGGPEGQSRPLPLGQNSYYPNELGVAIIYPNVRGSSGYGKTFLQLDNGFKREDSVKDIGALLDWIAAQPDLDKDRVMVTGGSYGGYMTLAVATHYNDRIRCSLDVVGISNFVTFLERTESYRRDLRRVEYGDEREAKMKEFLQQISPLTNAHKITKPLFVVQGRNDPRVPYTESEQIVATARKNGSPVWYLLAKDEGHGFAKKNNRDFLFYASVLFVKTHLLNGAGDGRQAFR
jgi:dipeptidyl aminopeptidase/acylaminoacyl peptidase